MNGREFLDAAHDLVALGKQAHWRTAAVSAYFYCNLFGDGIGMSPNGAAAK